MLDKWQILTEAIQFTSGPRSSPFLPRSPSMDQGNCGMCAIVQSAIHIPEVRMNENAFKG